VTSFDVTLLGEFHGSCIDPALNGEASRKREREKEREKFS
jgi:hypothetical protein